MTETMGEESVVSKTDREAAAATTGPYQVGMGPSKFKHVFRESCDMPPYVYLRKVRLGKAMCLLQLQGLSVTETALEMGYNSISHFAKALSSHFGVLPSEIRKRSGQNNSSVPA
jgi:AraC-like DNA-binding protein